MLSKFAYRINRRNSIKILINGEENAKFKDGEIDFSQNFIRNE